MCGKLVLPKADGSDLKGAESVSDEWPQGSILPTDASWLDLGKKMNRIASLTYCLSLAHIPHSRRSLQTVCFSCQVRFSSFPRNSNRFSFHSQPSTSTSHLEILASAPGSRSLFKKNWMQQARVRTTLPGGLQ